VKHNNMGQPIQTNGTELGSKQFGCKKEENLRRYKAFISVQFNTFVGEAS